MSWWRRISYAHCQATPTAKPDHVVGYRTGLALRGVDGAFRQHDAALELTRQMAFGRLAFPGIGGARTAISSGRAGLTGMI